MQVVSTVSREVVENRRRARASIIPDDLGYATHVEVLAQRISIVGGESRRWVKLW